MTANQNIWFFTEGITYKLRNKGSIRNWMENIINQEGFSQGKINIIFCSDRYLLSINAKYLKHNTLTDIVTFDLSEETGFIAGDIYISLERARENARIFGVKVSEELRRLIVHGLLHLAGYNDKEPGEKRMMTQKEDYYLSLPAG